MKKIILLLSTIAALFAMTQKLKVLTISGVVGIYGNMPHTFVAIKDKNGTLYKVKNPSKFHLLELQNDTIEVKAILIDKNVSARLPKEIKIIKVIK